MKVSLVIGDRLYYSGDSNHICRAVIDAQLREQGRDLSPMMGLVIEEMRHRQLQRAGALRRVDDPRVGQRRGQSVLIECSYPTIDTRVFSDAHLPQVVEVVA